jgi:hypothetical protein
LWPQDVSSFHAASSDRDWIRAPQRSRMLRRSGTRAPAISDRGEGSLGHEWVQ